MSSTPPTDSTPPPTKEAIEAMRKEVEQLRREAQVRPEKVSKVSKELLEFCEANKGTDPLLKKQSTAVNPYVDKKDCNMS